jgi:23S rRNA (adenine2503-C2)-methyltransferase
MRRLDLPLHTPPAARAVLEAGPGDLASWLAQRGQPALRARQVRRWVLQGHATSCDQMTDLPLALRHDLAAAFVPLASRVERHLVASDGTHKLLLALADGSLVECVLMREDDRRTVCLSTQVGCGMGCVFCASGIGGVVRNLTACEILEQAVQARNLLPPAERLTHVVVMGMGEPLANLDALLEALSVVCSRDGLGLSARHVHISTVGLPLKIRRLADLGKQYHLAVSLHAPNDELRNRVVPTNAQTGLAAILEAADYFYQTTKRQVTFEYVLLGGVNDSPAHAAELARLLRGRHAHVNLIPFNDVPGLPYRRPRPQALADFLAALRGPGLSVTVRKRKGADIDAACGQLRRAAGGTAPPAEPVAAAGV